MRRTEIYIYVCCRFKQKMEAQAIFLNPFTVRSLCKRKFVVCPFVDKAANGSYLFAKKRTKQTKHKLNEPAHLWVGVQTSFLLLHYQCSRKVSGKDFLNLKINIIDRTQGNACLNKIKPIGLQVSLSLSGK